MRQTSSLGSFSAHYVHKSPNLLHTAVRKIIITIFSSFGYPRNPITFLPPNRLCAFVFPLSPLPPLRHNTHVGEHAHRCSHTLASLVCVGGYQFDTGHCDYVFSVLQSGGGDKGPADHSKARHHSSDVGREAVVEGVKVAGGKDLYLILCVCFNHFKSSFPALINDSSSK